ncbi:DUF4129 domain-containing protein [Brevibacillus composti]|uniref:DUF4129 domain-containing protein n=1 Tax=Brevibacillus composti TaxID=2796470 RepID=A0ABX7Z850_9BACL|nr:DUF4129 domain-containing protein [Brevibacillus composti]QUO43066.1 DUF4129 domain-containing protein [Brevibacillus composti]
MIDPGQLADDREKLREILAREEFRENEEPGESWLDIAWEKILDALGDLLQKAEVSPGTASVLSWVIVLAAAAGAAALLYIGVRRMVRTSRSDEQLLTYEEVTRTHADYLRLAREKGNQGEWREGLRCSFLALLSYMQERSWIRIETWKTNWEYAEEIYDRQPEWEPFFRKHARLYEQAWYGRAELEPAVFWEAVTEMERRLDGEGLHEQRH